MSKQKNDGKVVAKNRKAYHDFFIEETLETGIELTGTEVKSIRQGAISLREAYASVERGELWLNGVHIAPYEQGNRFNADPLRKRRLLAHKYQIRRLEAQVAQKGLTLIPTQVYFKNGRVKVEIGLARGKKLYDKRQATAERDARRAIERRMKGGGDG